MFCRYVTPDSGARNMSVVLPLTDCGNLIRDVNSDTYVLNDIIIQAHRIVETDSDLVTSIVCKLPGLKSVELRERDHESHPVSYQNAEVEAWMDFQIGEDRLGIDVPNKLMVGDEIKIVINIKYDDKYKDLQLENCWAFEGEDILTSQYVVTLYDMHQCDGDNWISGFNVTKGDGNASHDTIYGKMKAFKFPVSKNIHFTCSVQVCKKSCFRFCEDLEWRTSSNHLKRSRRYIEVDSSDQSLRERNRLMKATIKALGAKLIEKNKRTLSENDTSFRKRYKTDDTVSEESELTENHENALRNVVKEIFQFNLSNNFVVYSSHEFNFRHEFDQISQTTAPDNCVPTVRFGIVTGSLSFALFCVIVTCIGLILYLRKENKKRRIDNFLLYNLR